MTSVENKILDFRNWIKKKNYLTKISETKNKYTTTADYNKFTKNIVANSIKSKKVVDKSEIAGFINNDWLDKKVATLAIRAELKTE